jgi:hypothetical protein
MRKSIIAGVGVLMLGLLVTAAGDPWKDKPFDQWTDRDIAAVLQTSPWVKVNLQTGLGSKLAGGQAITGGSLGTSGGAESQSKGTAGSLPGQTGGAEKNANVGPAVYNAFWFSSRTIREAVARRAMLHSGMDITAAKQFVDHPQDEYVIMVQGTDMSLFEERGEKAFQDAAFLQVKSTKQRINPTRVEFQKEAGGNSVVSVKFFFPKKDVEGEPTIPIDEKEVDFYLRIGSEQIRTFFEPRKMVDSQGQDL